ncbi:MAG: hypothetical protein M3Z84_02475 [Actinomycetota bacterium]|nr:hypothetical protein [Actinomycetota bacterium]
MWAGIGLPEQLEEARKRYPEDEQLVGRERFENFVPRMLAGVAAPPRGRRPSSLSSGVGHPTFWFTTRLGEFKQSAQEARRAFLMASLSASTLAPTWERWGVHLGPYGGLFRYLYLDVCPPSLQWGGIELIEVAHPVQNAVIDPPVGERLPGWVADLQPVPTAYLSLGTVFNQNLGEFRAILDGLGDLALK